MKKSKKIISFILLLSPFIFLNDAKASAATSTSQAAVVRTSGGNLNVRSDASTSSSIVGTLANKSYITCISKTGNWWKVEYKDDTYGYVSADYIIGIQSTPKKVTTNGGRLNVRASASTSATIKDQLYNNEYVLELSVTNGFSKIIYNGTKLGYASSTYIGNGSSYTYPSISLNVTSFKQFDSRWSSVLIGNRGSTMKQIGCATTALAMSESYRLGYTITPKTMASKLSYTSTGSLYWPSNYTSYTGSSYLTKIYNLLKSGKPVLVGAKKSDGGQHWVVVTGYNGSNSLSTKNFTINDPGSSYRTNLSELFSSYPSFYKLMYY